MSRNGKVLGRPRLAVLVGSEAPLVHTAAMTTREQPLQFAGALNQPLPAAHPARGGIEFLIKSVDASPGRVTILAIRPLTNIAIALRTRPDIATKIAGIVIMGGNVHVPGNTSKAAEFNFWFDPEAAQVVLRSEIPKKVLFALDVCIQTRFTKEMFDSVVAVKTPITALYREEFGNGYPGFLKDPNAQGYLWDELAASYLIDPSLVTRSETLHLDVESAFGPSYGAAKMLDRGLAPEATPVRVMFDIDFPRVYDLYRKALTGQLSALPKRFVIDGRIQVERRHGSVGFDPCHAVVHYVPSQDRLVEHKVAAVDVRNIEVAVSHHGNAQIQRADIRVIAGDDHAGRIDCRHVIVRQLVTDYRGPVRVRGIDN